MRVTLQDEARLAAHGYTVSKDRYLGPGGGVSTGYSLQDASCGENDWLMIGSHGCVSPTRWEAVAEGLARIDLDERLAAEGTDLSDPDTVEALEEVGVFL